MTLFHRPQKYLYGCLYHAIFAFTGDEYWLEHIEDFSEPRWLARLAAQGATVLTYYADLMTDTHTTVEFWEKLRDNIPEGTESLPLLITVDGISSRRHLVAMRLPRNGDVVISDSALSGLRSMSFQAFLTSNYANASGVQQLLAADVDAYPHESAPEFIARTDASPYQM